MFMRSGYSAQTRRTPSATEHHHCRTEVGVRLAYADARLGLESGGGALGLELGRGERGQLDGVPRGARAPVGGDRLADALEHDDVAARADRDREGEVAPAVALADVRRQRLGGGGPRRPPPPPPPRGGPP